MTKKLTEFYLARLVGFLSIRPVAMRPLLAAGSLIGSLLIGAGLAQNGETGEGASRAPQQAEMSVATATPEEPARFTFAWSAVEVPATIPFPLPPGVDAEEVTGVVLPDEVSVHGFAVEVDARELLLLVSPGRNRNEVSFDEILLLLERSSAQAHRVGPVRLVSAAAGGAVLNFERSVSATGAGLHLGVALHNASADDVLLHGVEYWPEEPIPGRRVLVATAEDAETLLSSAERRLTPSQPDIDGSTRSTGAPADPPVPVVGFRWLSAGQAVLVPADHRLVLVWTPESLPEAAESSSFLLYPVVVFASAAEPDRVERLGLPVALRSRH